MIVVKIHGGLGNQMFQYAFGKITAIRNNDSLALDISSYARGEGITKRSYGLHVFQIDDPVINDPKDIENLRVVKEPSLHFNPEFVKLSGNMYLDGYWQSYKYLSGFEETMRAFFRLKNPLGQTAQNALEKINNAGAQAVSIQIRRGDYVKNKRVAKEHGALSANFFKKAMFEISQKITQPEFFVFSEELGWFFKYQIRTPFKTHYISGKDIKDYEEIHLMSQCRHHIISNSTFGWWGAWLDNRPDKIVIAPEKYFKDEKMSDPELIPPNWISMPR